MINEEKRAAVSFALKSDILPHYLKRLFWEAAEKNPFTYWQKRKAYQLAVYNLSAVCDFGCLIDQDKDRFGHQKMLGKPNPFTFQKVFTSGFPKTTHELKKRVNTELVQYAADVMALQEYIGDRKGAEIAQGYFRDAFDAAKLLGLISRNATYDPYFQQAHPRAEAAATSIIEARQSTRFF
jgi:hypothetical protein